MCGIIWGLSKKGKKINKALLRRYRIQKARGSEGFGYVALYKDGLNYVRRETEKEIEKDIMEEDSVSTVFHHRLPTSTINVEETAHPIYVSHDELDYDYYVVHNGVISNADDLKKVHEKLGYEYNTVITEYTQRQYISKTNKRKYYGAEKEVEEVFNDSESLAIEVARNIDGMCKDIDTYGSVAFICVQVDKKTQKPLKVYYGHNDRNPLHIEEDRDFLWVKSVGGKDLETHRVFCYDLQTGKTTDKYQYIGKSYTSNTENKTNTLVHSPYHTNNGVYSNEDDIQMDDEDDYKRQGQMGFLPPSNNSNNDKFNYDYSNDNEYGVVSSDPKVVSLIERTLRLKYIREDHLLALNKYNELIKDGKTTFDEVQDTLREHQNEIDKLTMSLVDIEVDFYSMAKLHDNLDFEKVLETYTKDFDEDEIRELLGVHTNYDKQFVMPDGSIF